jgi:hypothetical protein
MYNFSDSSVTASAFTAGANTSLTLVASTAGLTTNSPFIIYFDDQTTALPAGTNRIGVVTIGGGTIGGTVAVQGIFNDEVFSTLKTEEDGTLFTKTVNSIPAGTNRIGVVTIGAGTVTIGAGTAQIGSVTASISGTVPISISSVTVGNSVTIGSLPAISGTVTAVLSGTSYVEIAGGIQNYVFDYTSFPISGTVTIGSALPAGTNQIGAVTANNQSLTTGSGSLSGTSAVGTDVLPSTDVSGFAEMMIQFTGTFPSSANAQFQVSNDNSTFVSQAALQVGQTSPQATISALGMYKISLGGARYIRLRVTVQGSTSNYIYSYTLNPRTSFNSTQPVHIVSQTSLAAGTNRIGVVTIGAGTVTIGAGTEQIGSVTANLAISSSAITFGSFASLSSATLVPANTARKMATVYNLGAGQLFINAGASATTLGGGFMVALSSGDFYECDYTTTTLSAIFATAGTASWVSH